MARLKLRMFGTPEDELAETVDGAVPQWIERHYAPADKEGSVRWSRGLTP